MRSRSADLYTLAEASARFPATPAAPTWRRWIKAGWAPAAHPARPLMVSLSDVAAARLLAGLKGRVSRLAWRATARLLKQLAAGRTPAQLREALAGTCLYRSPRRRAWQLLSREAARIRVATERGGRAIWLQERV